MTRSSPPSVSALLRALDAQLRSRADPRRAAGERAYLKSDLTFRGVRVPELRRATRTLLRRGAPWTRARRWQLVRRAWRSRVHELRGVAIILLEHQAAEMDTAELDGVEELLRTSGTWAYVDPLAVHVAGPVLRRRGPRDRTLERWARDPDFWIRRSALLALLRPEREGGVDFPRFARLAAPMLGEREFFVRKAIGWVLREVGKRHPERTFGFLTRHRSRVAGLTLREGARYLPSRERRALGLSARAPPRGGRAGRTSARRPARPPAARERYTRRTVPPRATSEVER